MLHDDVRQARIDHGLSQLKLARQAGIPRSQLLKFESGGNITLETLRRILRQLPNLKSVRIEAVELQLEQLDIPALRLSLTELVAAASHVLNVINGSTAASGATEYEGVNQATAELTRRLQELSDSATGPEKERDV
jgi:transcriptional regulator with XRE-family HTH domain